MSLVMALKKFRVVSVINGFLALLVIAAFLLVVRDVISLFTGSFKMPQPRSASVPGKEIPKKGLMDYSAVLKKNPFGFYAGELSSLGSKSEGAGKLSDVTLVGTISGDRRYSYAVFADNNNAQEIFKLGDSVFGLGKLEAVRKDMVIINDAGRRKEIQITDIIVIRESPVTGVKASAPSEPFTGDKFAKKVTDTAYVIDAQRVQQSLANPNQIMTDARLLPNFIGGKQEGFIMKEVKPGGLYQSIGLQNGDVLLRVNEYHISNPEAALQAFTALKGMDRVQLDIIRAGTKMTMTYQIK